MFILGIRLQNRKREHLFCINMVLAHCFCYKNSLFHISCFQIMQLMPRGKNGTNGKYFMFCVYMGITDQTQASVSILKAWFCWFISAQLLKYWSIISLVFVLKLDPQPKCWFTCQPCDCSFYLFTLLFTLSIFSPAPSMKNIVHKEYRTVTIVFIFRV